MDTVLKGVLIGGVLGGIVTFAADNMKKHKPKEMEFGYEWNYVKRDLELATVLYKLKSFKHADSEAYYKIGEACNGIVSLYMSIEDPENNQSIINCQYNALKYRDTVNENLIRLSKSIPEIEKRLKHDELKYERANPTSSYNPPAKDPTKNTNMVHFVEVADQICEIVHKYYYNILLITGKSPLANASKS